MIMKILGVGVAALLLLIFMSYSSCSVQLQYNINGPGVLDFLRFQEALRQFESAPPSTQPSVNAQDSDGSI